MNIREETITGWSFHIEEVSAGVYLAIGTNRAGRTVAKKGIDPDTLIEECKQAALDMPLAEAE